MSERQGEGGSERVREREGVRGRERERERECVRLGVGGESERQGAYLDRTAAVR